MFLGEFTKPPAAARPPVGVEAPVTTIVPATVVLPDDAVTLNLLVLTAKLPDGDSVVNMPAAGVTEPMMASSVVPVIAVPVRAVNVPAPGVFAPTTPSKFPV